MSCFGNCHNAFWFSQSALSALRLQDDHGWLSLWDSFLAPGLTKVSLLSCCLMKNTHHWSLPLAIYSLLSMSSCPPPPHHLCHWSCGSLNFLLSALDSSSTTISTLTSLMLSLSQIYFGTQVRVSVLLFPLLAFSSSCSGENFLHLQTSLLNLATQQATSWAFYWAFPSSLHTKTAASHVYTRYLAWMYPQHGSRCSHTQSLNN